MVQWGATTGHMQVGIDVRHDPYDATTPTINVYVDFYVRTIAYGAQDHQVLTAYVNGGGWQAFPYFLNSPTGATTLLHVGTIRIPDQGLSYGGGPGYSFHGAVSDSDIGQNPTHTIGWTLPAKPPNIPLAPPTGVDSMTASSARVVVFAADGRGAGIDAYQVRVRRVSDGVTVFQQVTGGTVTVGGLQRATAYVYSAAAHNAVGWSAWAAEKSFSTTATAPDAPTSAPTPTSSTPDALGFSWTAPATGGSAITGYDLQVSTSSGFATASTVSTTATQATATGLIPATTYFARVRARNAVGVGAWSASRQVETLSSVKVAVAGTWQRARVWVRTGTGWVQARVWKRHVDGVWRL